MPLRFVVAEKTAVTNGYISHLLYRNEHLMAGWRQSDKWGEERLNWPLSGHVMSRQNVWVTVNCPATQTIEGNRLAHPGSHLFVFTEVVMTVPRKWPQELGRIHRKWIPLLSIFFPFNFSNSSRQIDFCATAPFDVSVFFILEFYCWCWTFQTLSGWTLIRLAVSHSLEISYAVWACCYFWRTNHELFPPLLWLCVCKSS